MPGKPSSGNLNQDVPTFPEPKRPTATPLSLLLGPVHDSGVLLPFQGELKVPLLRHPGQARLAAQQTAGRHAVHAGPPPAARPAEAEVPSPRPPSLRPNPMPPLCPDGPG